MRTSRRGRAGQDVGGLRAGGVPAAARAAVPPPGPVAGAPAVLPARHRRAARPAAAPVLPGLRTRMCCVSMKSCRGGLWPGLPHIEGRP